MELNLRRARAEHVSHERWLVSYADFVTLLFAFFVVLYASAQVDRQRALQLSDAIRSGFQQLGVFQGEVPVGPGARSMHSSSSATGSFDSTNPELSGKDNSAETNPQEFAKLRNELERVMSAQIDRGEVTLHMERDGLVVTLREIGFFDSGSADLKPEAEKTLAHIAAILKSHSCAIRIEGHTDNIPIHTAQFASNWELSTARATGLVRSLAETYGISPALLSAAGYAEFRPASANDTDQGRAMNRRVDLVILRSQSSTAAAADSSHARHDRTLIQPADLNTLGALRAGSNSAPRKAQTSP
jgi:chemotaxis protein MotB